MLNERQIELLPERIYQRLNKINTEYLESIGKVIIEIGELRPSDTHKLQQMYQYGTNGKKMAEKLAEVSAKNIEEIYEIFDIVAKDNYNYAKPFYKAKGKPFIPYEENESLKNYVKSLAKQTVDEYVNLTQHTAFAIFADKKGKSIAPLFSANKNKVATSLSDTYTKVIDYAVTKVQAGVTDYNSAIREVTKALADSGIRTVDYATGYSRRLDTSVRQNVLWGIKQCNQNTADFIGKDFGADGYEISYHSHPRLSHADMGGRRYAIGKARTVNGVYYPSFSEVEHLLEEYNCLHFKFPILLGISQPAIDEDELERLKVEDKKTFKFEGKEYTKYEASQLQRKIETEIRHQKDRAIIAKAAGDIEMQEAAQMRINLLTSKYSQLSKESGLPTKTERMQVKGFKSFKVDKMLTNGGNSGIINVDNRLSELGRFKERIRTDKAMKKEYYAAVKDKFSHGSDFAKTAFNKFVPDNSIIDSAFEGPAKYNTKTKKISMHYDADLNNPRGACITYFHEHGHLIDDVAGNLSNNKVFKTLLQDDALSYRKAYGKLHGLKTFDDVDKSISKELNSMRKHSGVSDILEGLTGGNINGIAGHDSDYWKIKGNLEAEAFAHMFASQFDEIRYLEMKKFFPQSLNWFESKLKEAVK